MRFAIKDLLLGTFLAAIAAVGIHGSLRVQKLREKIAETQASTQTFQSQTQIEKIGLKHANARLDLVAEIAKVHQPALKEFANFQERYGTITPKPDSVSIRRVPALAKTRCESPQHYRISVPDQHRVFLRSGLADAESVSSNQRTKLDDQDWIQSHLVSGSTKSQTLLAPGIHDLHITIHRAKTQTDFPRLELILDGQLLAAPTVRDPKRKFSSWSSQSLRTQYEIDFNRGSRFLMEIEIDNTLNQAIWEYWIWLSSNDKADFQDYPAIKAGDGDTNE